MEMRVSARTHRVSWGLIRVGLLAICVGLFSASARLSGRAGQESVNGARGSGRSGANYAQGPGYEVAVTKVSEMRTEDGSLRYDIAYRYRFAKRSTVYVPGLGIVPGSGAFSYLTAGTELEFRESLSGSVLTVVPLETTMTGMGAGEAEVATDEQFQPTFKSATWADAATFPAAATEVMQKFFGKYEARPLGPLNAYVTSYRPLLGVAQNIRAEAAVRISQPYDPASRRFTFRVQVVVRDRPRQSKEWSFNADCRPATLAAAESLHTELMKSLTDFGRNGK